MIPAPPATWLVPLALALGALATGTWLPYSLGMLSVFIWLTKTASR